MTDDERIDELVKDAWPTSEVTDDLRASTMERIHRAASEGRSEEAAPSESEAAPVWRVRIMRFPRWAWVGIAAALLVVALGIGCRRMHLAGGMMHRRIQGVELHGFIAGVDNVVPGARWNHHAPAVFHVFFEGECILGWANLDVALARIQA